MLQKLELQFIVAIRSNHTVLMPPGAKVRYNRWHEYTQQLSHRQSEQRFIREIIFGKRRSLRYFQITKSEALDPQGDDSWYVMTNLPGKIEASIARLYSLRMWIEYGFKQVKNELGWADFRLTDYASIERWWEIVFSAYLLVSIQASYFQEQANNFHQTPEHQLTIHSLSSAEFSQHPWWESGTTWKSALNNLRLIIQPYIFYCLTRPWLQVFKIPGFRRCFWKLISIMNDFRASPISLAAA